MNPKKFFLFLLFIMLVFVGHSRAEIVERIVARVNDQIITLGELEAAYRELKSTLAGEVFPGKRELLNRMVEEKLLLQEAKEQGIKVSPGEIEENIEKLKSQFLSEKAFELTLKKEGINIEKLQKRYEEELLIKKFIDIEVRPRAEVSKDDVREYYKKNKKEFKEQEQVRIRYILFEKEAEAQRALERLKAGTDFEEIGERRQLASFRRGQLNKKIEGVAFSLKKGEVSPIIKTKAGYHIIKLEKKKEARVKDFSEVRKIIRNFLTFQRMEKELEEYLEDLTRKQRVEIKL